MEVFNCRSPFIVEVNVDDNQTATKVELYIWKIGDTTPDTPTKVIEKTKYSDTQFINYYNISPFVYDVINTISDSDFAYNVVAVIYYKTTGDWVYDNDLSYVSVNGYNSYATNSNYSYNTSLAVLQGSYVPGVPTIDYFLSPIDEFSFFLPTIDLILDFQTFSGTYRIKYTTTEFVEDHYEVFETTEDYTNSHIIELHRVRMITSASAGVIISTTFEVQERPIDGSWTTVYEALLTPICEPKYSPFILNYVNSSGGLQKITLFKNSTKTIDVKSSEYNTNTFTAGYPNYDTSLGQKRIFNKNGGTTIKCNTGWISEGKNYDIQDMMLSENLFLISLDNSIYNAVTLKNTSQLMKTHLNEKVINYEFEFEVANKLINNVV